MADRSGTILLSDGDVGSLVALTHACERLASEPDGAVRPPVLVAPIASRDRSGVSAIRRQAALFGAEVHAAFEEAGRDADLLLKAGRLAIELGRREVVWPAHAGVPVNPDQIDLERASTIANMGLLVERLLGLESADAPTISCPFADLSDRQLAELSVDLGLLPGDVWWSPLGDDRQRVAGERWIPAFEACGVTLREPSRRRAGSARG